MHHVGLTFAPQFHPETELPDQQGTIVVHDLFGNDETRFGYLVEHVTKNALNGVNAANFVEGVFEVGVGAVELAEAGDALRSEFVVKADQWAEVHPSLR